MSTLAPGASGEGCVMVSGDAASELAVCLAISPQAIEEAIRRGLLSFVKHRNSRCWRFGDSRNGSFRRVDGEPFRINGDYVKAEAETRGESWHHLIGLEDVHANDRSDILLTLEGSKDALEIARDSESSVGRVGERITYPYKMISAMVETIAEDESSNAQYEDENISKSISRDKPSTAVTKLRLTWESQDAIEYAQFYSRSHDAVIRVYDDAGNVLETHEHTGDFKEP